MSYASDVDVYTGWAEAICQRRFSQTVERKYNAAVIFNRAQGRGRIRHIEGLEPLLRELGPAIVCVDLLPLGAPRRNWRATLISDGYLIVRHHDLETTMAMADKVGTDLRIYAG